MLLISRRINCQLYKVVCRGSFTSTAYRKTAEMEPFDLSIDGIHGIHVLCA